jgi:hypothetical protein
MKKTFIYKVSFFAVIFLLSFIIFTIVKDMMPEEKDDIKIKPMKKEILQITPTEAISKAEEFCKRFSLQCSSPSIKDLFQIGGTTTYLRIHNIWGSTYKPFGVYVSMYEKSLASEGVRDPYIHVAIGGKSKEIEFYNNVAIYQFYHFKKYKGLEWPEFMPEEKAMTRFNSLANKLSLPEDMVFENLEKDKKRGMWTAYWLRKWDGYWYEGDAITIEIMGVTGEFVGYTKTYRGVPCPTDIKVNKEQALALAWKKLSKKVPRKIRDKVKDIYKIKKAELLIIQTNELERSSVPVTIAGSKLSWVIKYYFTGGLIDNRPLNKAIELLTKEERKAEGTYLKALDDSWENMGQPPRDFEVRIDAATGEFLYVSRVSPWYWQWFSR